MVNEVQMRHSYK